MIKQSTLKDPRNDYPALNIVIADFNLDEVQIHQGAALSEEIPTLGSDMKRDVVSISKEQAIELAHLILETYK